MAGGLSTRKRKAAQTDDTTPNAEGKGRRKKQGVTKTKSAAVKALIQQNQVNSPLLKLAPEVREKILTYLVGNQVLHLHHSDQPIFACDESDEETRGNKPKLAFIHYYVCQADTSRAYAYNQGPDNVFAKAAAEDPAAYYVENPDERHGFCRHLVTIKEERHNFHLSLDVLGTCRQLYEEANHLLWSTNTFAFNGPRSFKIFFNSLNPAQKRNLTKLAFFADMDRGSRAPRVTWEQALRPANLKMLQGLTALSLCFKQHIEEWDWAMFDYEYSSSIFWRSMEAFILFRMFPLKQVFVTVSDNVSWLVNTGRSKGLDGNLESRWTAAQKIQFAREWEEKLLDADPAATIEAEEDAAELAARESAEKSWAKILAIRQDHANSVQAEAKDAAADLEEAQLDPTGITSSTQEGFEGLIRRRKAKAESKRVLADAAMKVLEKLQADSPMEREERAAARKADREVRIRRQVSIMPKARASTKSTPS